MPADHVEPEGVVEARASGEVGEVLTDGSHQAAEEGLATEGRDSNVARSEPSAINGSINQLI